MRKRTARAAIRPSMHAEIGTVVRGSSVWPVSAETAAATAVFIAVVCACTKLSPKNAMIAIVMLAMAVLPTVFR
jgi:hypothetical protein